MIKFFSKIRKNMIKENKASKYLLYAIGEIVLVVIGILIALQINNWNERQKNKQQELNKLENIYQDLKNDKAGLIATIERRTSKANSADLMVKYHNGLEIEKLSDYYFHWTNVLYWEAHYPRNIAFKELVNSGNVSIISNANIRNSLLDIDASYQELFAVREHLYDDYTIYLYKPYANIIDYGSGIKVWTKPTVKIDLSQEDVKQAIKSKTIKNGLILASFNNIGLRDQLIKILETVDSTIILIEKEIKK